MTDFIFYVVVNALTVKKEKMKQMIVIENNDKMEGMVKADDVRQLTLRIYNYKSFVNAVTYHNLLFYLQVRLFH